MGKFQQAIDCLTPVKNTGASPSCLKMKHAKKILLVPKGTVLTPAQVAALQNTIDTNAKTDTKSQRWFLSHQIAGIEDKSEDPVMENVPLQGSMFVRYGFNSFDYRFVEGGLYGHKVRTSFNGMQDFFDAFIFDPNALWGYEDIDPSSGLPIMCPFSLSDMNAFMKVPTGSDVGQFLWHLGFLDPEQLQKRMVGVQYNFSLDTIKGLKQVELSFLGEPSANVFKVAAYTGGGGTDLAGLFGNTMANSNYWVLKNAITGSTIPTTTITAAADGWLITPTTANASYPGIGEYFTVEWAAPSALPAGLTSLYESDKIFVKRTQ